MNTDTPLPPDEPTAPNPPEGAIINYYLKSAASGPVTLEILGADGKLGRKYSSTDEVFTPDPATITVPPYWFRPLHALPATAGMHRFTWDLHYQPLDALDAAASAAGRAEPADCRDRTQHRAGSDDAVGEPGHVYGEADGERQDLLAADDGETGSARQDAGAVDAGDLHAFEGDVLHRSSISRKLRNSPRPCASSSPSSSRT